jgi:threonine dehydrogenase-like Zn-dependent dehydrogenase
MKAVLFPGDRKVQVVDRPDPRPSAGEVLIKTGASAICRSDMSLYYGAPPVGGELAATGTIVPGHEPAGEVVEAGVTKVKPGDRVSVHLAFGCGQCSYCQSGYFMLCPSWKCLGIDVDGGDADYFLAPEQNCLPLPDELSFAAGAVMTDMVGTQYVAQKRLGVSGKDTVAYFGIGPMGAAGVLVGKARGARVIAVDVVESRLNLALRLGADEVVNSAVDDPVKRLHQLTHGEGVDMAIDSSGNPAGQNAALDSVRKMGSAAFIGESKSTTINPSDQFIRKLLTVIGAWYFPVSEWTEIVHFVVDRQVPVENIISDRVPLSDAPEAFLRFDRRETDKVVFVWD